MSDCNCCREQVQQLEERLRKAKYLQRLTEDNEVEWMRRHAAAEAEGAGLRARLQAFEAFEKAAQKFVDKCESGRAQSRETYADMKACLAATLLQREG